MHILVEGYSIKKCETDRTFTDFEGTGSLYSFTVTVTYRCIGSE